MVSPKCLANESDTQSTPSTPTTSAMSQSDLLMSNLPSLIALMMVLIEDANGTPFEPFYKRFFANPNNFIMVYGFKLVRTRLRLLSFGHITPKV